MGGGAQHNFPVGKMAPTQMSCLPRLPWQISRRAAVWAPVCPAPRGCRSVVTLKGPFDWMGWRAAWCLEN